MHLEPGKLSDTAAHEGRNIFLNISNEEKFREDYIISHYGVLLRVLP